MTTGPAPELATKLIERIWVNMMHFDVLRYGLGYVAIKVQGGKRTILAECFSKQEALDIMDEHVEEARSTWGYSV